MGTQLVGQSGGAKNSITLADDIFWREPAFMPRRPKPDEFADRIKVGKIAKKLLRLFILRSAAETGRHWINKYEIARVQNGILIVHQAERRRRQRALRIHLQPSRDRR